MATSYQRQAQKQLDPVFNQQQKAIEAQLPSIENLYNTLTTGLQTSYQTNLASGVQGIVEDASARGVLRSTLPVDARQSLTTQLGAALQQSLGELGARRTGDIANVRNSLAELGVKRVSSIADLARALETQDLERQQFEWQKKKDWRQLKLQEQELALARSSAGGGGGGGSIPQWQATAFANQGMFNNITEAFGTKNAKTPGFTEKVLLPMLYQKYGGTVGIDAINKAVYQYRKNSLGF